MQPNLLCCDLACSAAASAWKLWPVRYCEDMVQSGRILIRSRHWSHIQHSINFTHMNRMQVNTSFLLIWVLILHSFTVLHQYVATSECLLWVVEFLIALVGEWFNDSYFALLKCAFCVEMYFLPHYHYVIHCWFPFDSGLSLVSEWDAVADTHLFWCLEPCRCAWYCATELSVTLQTSHVWLRFRPKNIHKYKHIY